MILHSWNIKINFRKRFERLNFILIIIPMQLATHGQWWSNRAMQQLQREQCFERNGLRMRQVEQNEDGSNPLFPLSANSIIVWN